MNLQIKLAESSDYLALIDFFKENNIPEVKNNFNPFPLDESTAYRITKENRVDRYYLVYIEQEIVGLSMLRGWEEGYEIPSFGILIDHRFHHRGIGRQLTIRTIDEAKSLGCRKIRLSVFEENHNALHLYQSLQFREISKESVIHKGGHVTKIIMVRDLDNDLSS